MSIPLLAGIVVIFLMGCAPQPEGDTNGGSAGTSAPTSDASPLTAPPVMPTAVPTEVEFEPRSISLDYGAREMIIRGTLRKAEGAPAPEKVWVWAYFTNPNIDTRGSWSDSPLEVRPRFGKDGTARITARGHFHWANNPDLPRSGYYARVSVSSISEDAARVPASSRDYSTSGAVRVRSSE